MHYYEMGCWSLLLILSVTMLFGCVAWVDRLPPPELPLIEPAGDASSIVIVVRSKQFALSGVTFTILIDEVPVANLESGQYTRFQVSPNEHILEVRWDIGGLSILGGGPGGGGFIMDPLRTYANAVTIRCSPADDCFITLGTKGFARQEEERVIVRQVDVLEGDFSLQDKKFVIPGAVRPE